MYKDILAENPCNRKENLIEVAGILGKSEK